MTHITLIKKLNKISADRLMHKNLLQHEDQMRSEKAKAVIPKG